MTAGKLMQLDAAKMTNALGIAGSLSSGLMEFAHAGDGAMVKKLHLGRAAESGVLAASLASDGFTGPSTVLEGEAGYLHAFCLEWDTAELTRGLGQDYASMSIMMKRFACHITAHRPVEGMLDLKNEYKFSPADVESIAITGNQRMATTNNIPVPPDVLLAQYSIPFSVALSVYRNPVDPASFDDNVARDRDILAMAARVKMLTAPGQAKGQPRQHGRGHAEGWPHADAPRGRFHGNAGAAAGSGGPEGEVHAADQTFSPGPDGAPVRPAAEHREREHAGLADRLKFGRPAARWLPRRSVTRRRGSFGTLGRVPTETLKAPKIIYISPLLINPPPQFQPPPRPPPLGPLSSSVLGNQPPQLERGPSARCVGPTFLPRPQCSPNRPKNSPKKLPGPTGPPPTNGHQNVSRNIPSTPLNWPMWP